MIASAKNGFMQTSFADCSGTPFNYQPEYSTARRRTSSRGRRSRTNISTQFEIGHFEPCTSVQNPMPITLGTFHDTIWQDCTSPYESTTMPDGGRTRRSATRPAGPRASRTAAPLRPTRWRGASRPSRRTATWTSTARPTGPTGRAGRRPTTGRRPSSRCNRRPAATDTRGSSSRRMRRRAKSLPPDRRRMRGTAAGRSREVLPVVDPGQGERRVRLGVRPDAKRQHLRPDEPVRRPVRVLLREPGRPDSRQPELLST